MNAKPSIRTRNVSHSQGRTRCVFVIAGEPSGDILGAAAIEAICRDKALKNVCFKGVGGPLMEKAGRFRSLVPLKVLAVMGLGFLPRLPQILRAFFVTKRALLKTKPDVLLSFDAPDFSLRLAACAPKGTVRMHCVAPSVWAWRAGRAAKIARVLDRLLVLFPFEPPYFEKHGLSTTFVGHPKAETVPAKSHIFWRAHPTLSAKKPLLLLMPGSRAQEIKTLLPIFLEVARQSLASMPDLQVALLTLPTMRAKLEKSVPTGMPFWVHVVSDSQQGAALMRAATAALVASGTATLELGLAACPMVVAYRVWPPLAFVLRRLIKTPFAALPNILHQKEVVPECLQKKCTPEKLLEVLWPLLRRESPYRVQKKHLLRLASMLQAKESFDTSIARCVASGLAR